MSVFEESLDSLKQRLANIEIDASTIMTVLRFAMETVEATQLKGAAQKQLCKKLIRSVIEEAPISDDKEKLLLDLVDHGILENTMDLVIDATKGRLDINQVVKVAQGCCFPFIKQLTSK